MNNFKYTILILTVFVAFSCTNPPDYPDEPVITYVGINQNTFLQGFASTNPELQIVVDFTDGDGDIGDENNMANFFLFDSRTPLDTTTFSIPFVPEQGTGNGISGEITLKIGTTLSFFCCFYPNGQLPCSPSAEFPIDTLTYEMQMIDRAGNVSNTVVTDPIFVLCE